MQVIYAPAVNDKILFVFSTFHSNLDGIEYFFSLLNFKPIKGVKVFQFL